MTPLHLRSLGQALGMISAAAARTAVALLPVRART